MSKTGNAATGGDRTTGRAIRPFRNPTTRTNRMGGRDFDALPDWMEDMTLGEFERMRSEWTQADD